MRSSGTSCIASAALASRSRAPSAGFFTLIGHGGVLYCRRNQWRGRDRLTRSLGDDAPLRDVLVKIVIKVVAAWAERGQAYRDRLAGLNRFFTVAPEALKLDRLVARVHDPERARLTRRHGKVGGRKTMALEAQLDKAPVGVGGGGQTDGSENGEYQNQQSARRHLTWPPD